MAKVLALVDRDPRDGTVLRSACALLTLARRFGEPVAVVGGDRPDDEAIRTLGRFGAVEVWCLAESGAALKAGSAPAFRAGPESGPLPVGSASADQLAEPRSACVAGSESARLPGLSVSADQLAEPASALVAAPESGPLPGRSASVDQLAKPAPARVAGAESARLPSLSVCADQLAEPASALVAAHESGPLPVGSASADQLAKPAPALKVGPDSDPATDTDLLQHLAARLHPAAILIPATHRGQETAARLAVRLDSGIITNAVDVLPGPDGAPVAIQRCLAGSYLVESSVVRGTPVITVRPEAAVPEPRPVTPVLRTAEVEPAKIPSARIVASSETIPDRPGLDHADIVVAGGRGIGSRAAFAVLAEVADALGAAVAGSHTAAELGWVPREARVGLTGKTVQPRLYLACGVSGSVRHRAGMQGAKTVVAIGDDPQAPIFKMADLGVVGDVRAILPALLAEIRARKARNGGTTGSDQNNWTDPNN